jgi:DNA-binding IclR family transcriptional regulator
MLPDSPHNSPGLRSSLAILARLADSGGLPFTRLRREVALPAATVSRLLKVLAEEGWVAGGGQEPWRPGPAFRAAAWRLAPRADLAELIQPVVDGLAEATGESAAFVEWGGDGIVFRVKCERPESYHYLNIGQRNRGVIEHPFAMLCLAHSDQAAERRYASAARKVGIDLPALLARIRNEGAHSGFDKGHRVCAPVIAHGGAFLGAIGVTHIGPEPDARLSERFKRLVIEHARRAATLIDQSL